MDPPYQDTMDTIESEKLSMADLILFAQTSASMHFARGSLHYAAVVDIRKILENCPPDVKEAIAKRFQQYQEDALGYDPSAALFLERRKTAVLREQNVTLQAKVAAMQALIGSSGRYMIMGAAPPSNLQAQYESTPAFTQAQGGSGGGGGVGADASMAVQNYIYLGNSTGPGGETQGTNTHEQHWSLYHQEPQPVFGRFDLAAAAPMPEQHMYEKHEDEEEEEEAAAEQQQPGYPGHYGEQQQQSEQQQSEQQQFEQQPG
ncbi:hypothetical protein FIBSPDRAFT_962472, partial [Athelia psychrophila]